MTTPQNFQHHFATAPSHGDPAENTRLGQIAARIQEEMQAAAPGLFDLRLNDSQSYGELKKKPELQTAMARFLYRNRHEVFRPLRREATYYPELRPGFALFIGLMRANLQMLPDELLDWILTLKEDRDTSTEGTMLQYENWPIGFIVQQIERKSKKKPLTKGAMRKLAAIADWPEMQPGQSHTGYGTDFGKVGQRIRTILAAQDGDEAAAQPYKRLSGDEFGAVLEAEIAQMGAEKAGPWHRVFNHAATASGGKPTAKFSTLSDALKDDLGKEWLRRALQGWLAHAVSAKVVEVETHSTWGGQTHTWMDTTVFTKSNTTLLKGLVWMAGGYRDGTTVNLIADLCEKSMRKIPGVGPAAQAVANACLRYLEITPGTEATARLARLSTAIKQKSVQKKVAEIVAQKAEAAGITTVQLEERVVPTYGLTQGEKIVPFDDYSLHIRIDGPGRVIQTWHKPDGTPQKTKPAMIAGTSALKAKFDKTKAEVVNLKKVLTAQRDRIDRLFAEDLTWPLEEVETYYVGHDLVCTVASKLIWELETDSTHTAALYREGGWQDIMGKPVKTDETTQARLWHPIDHSTDTVMAWRARITALELLQPMKQAYREVYHLTDAERATGVYSNRMAAHMLKQHQMATLMAARGWRYQLMGAYDDGLDDQWAHKTFVTTDLAAEYLIHTNWDEDNFNDAGVYLYVGTDQLRFTRSGMPVPLDQVPVRLFSETMREADLFVGVGSVGNDPAWHDQGPTPESRNYWQSYSFGVLDNFAETRKQVLETLLPRLKIRDKAHIDGNFLIVDGRLNTYKIHLGSSNILMSPGDRYLCIVPGAVSKGTAVALPFEGDNRLSVILSKALMLAEDDKITASDIVRQLKR